jgi:NMD protein affecting ribosome stability and mRNA decay
VANVLRSGKWSKNYPQCQNCGTTSIEHRAYGLCNRCYLYAYRVLGTAKRIKQAITKRKDEGKAKSGRD